jgi:hypothetical protein
MITKCKNPEWERKGYVFNGLTFQKQTKVVKTEKRTLSNKDFLYIGPP